MSMSAAGLRQQYRVVSMVAIVAAAAAWLVFGPASAWVPTDGSTFVFGWLFAPAAIGEVLVGGVHGGAPEWLRLFAMCLSNAAGWGALAYLRVRPRATRLA